MEWSKVIELELLAKFGAETSKPYTRLSMTQFLSPFSLAIFGSTLLSRPNTFTLQSLVLLCALSLLLALLFLLATVIVWVTQCCIAHRSGASPSRTSRRHVGRLSCALFLVSVLCFALMGVCLYGNELLNKSVHQSATGLEHLGDGFRRAMIQVR